MKQDKQAAARIPATLEAKVQAYETRVQSALFEDFKRYGLSLRAAAELLEDLAAFLRRKDEPPHLRAESARELAGLYGRLLKDSPSMKQSLPLYMILESYNQAGLIMGLLDTLRHKHILSSEEAMKADAAAQRLLEQSPLLAWKILQQRKRYTFILPVEKALEKEYGEHQLFLIISAAFLGATQEELSAIKAPHGLDAQEAARKAIEATADYRAAVSAPVFAEAEQQANYDKNATDSGILTGRATALGEEAAGLIEEAPYIKHADADGRRGFKTQSGVSMEDEEEMDTAERQRKIRIRNSTAVLLSKPIEGTKDKEALRLSLSLQGRESLSGIVTQRAEHLIRKDAEGFEISEAAIYRGLTAIALIAQGKPTERFKGVNGGYYYQYEPESLWEIAKKAYGGRNPKREEVKELWDSFYFLKNFYPSIDEKIIVKYFDDTKKFITEDRKAFIQVVNFPEIVTPVAPKDRRAETILLTPQIHSFFVQGRTQATIENEDAKKQRLHILQPKVQSMTQKQYDLARSLFGNKESGIRFFFTLIGCGHMKEEDLLAQVFNYEGKRLAADTKEKLQKVENNIKNNKDRDRKQVAKWFEGAAAQGFLLNQQRYWKAKGNGSSKRIWYWEWQRFEPAEGAEVDADKTDKDTEA